MALGQKLCYTDTLTYPYPILVGDVDTDTRIHHLSGFFFEKVCICVSDTYYIGYSYSCNVGQISDTYYIGYSYSYNVGQNKSLSVAIAA